jgi:hypothetical protein
MMSAAAQIRIRCRNSAITVMSHADIFNNKIPRPEGGHLRTGTRSADRLFGGLPGGFAQTVFQFVNQLREPYRGRGVTCSHHQSATQFKLPFELFSITLLIYDGTLLLYSMAYSIADTVG